MKPFAFKIFLFSFFVAFTSLAFSMKGLTDSTADPVTDNTEKRDPASPGPDTKLTPQNKKQDTQPQTRQSDTVKKKQTPKTDTGSSTKTQSTTSLADDDDDGSWFGQIF